METLEQAKKKYQGEWIAFLVKEENRETLGEVLDHDRDKRTLHTRLREKKIPHAYVAYSGPYVKPGYEVMF